MAGGEGEAEVPLLEKKPEVYFDGCPGCAMDRRKAENSGIPYCLTMSLSLAKSELHSLPYQLTQLEPEDGGGGNISGWHHCSPI
ncbi:hypothetical protein HU200_064636 [Digitaria exilis]|uniref:Uncharacterized protein n=1 Tax=Digitaria exilis TaxID=1010633 RepID=A0A835A557_9POAL|nr:hypothetical protein HU200_064636 [Digitaria exilis]